MDADAMLALILGSSVPAEVLQVCRQIDRAGGRAWLVGGCVRDLALGVKSKDWDMEVYGLEGVVLSRELQTLGRCAYVGKQFGVMKLWLGTLDIDVALPRTEVKTSAGHKGFEVVPNPYISPEKAVLRRDFTINAMMFDPLVGVYLDFHHGLIDLAHKRLRHVSCAFAEDPLRPLRAMQFAARFQLQLSTETALLCQGLLTEARALPTSRLWQEWLKWAQSDFPSFGLRALQDMGWLPLYPELEALVRRDTFGCRQSKEDVWEHVCLVVDAAARLSQERSLSGEESLLLMFAALCHGFSRPTMRCADAQGEVCSERYVPTDAGLPLQFLQRIAAPKSIKRLVAPLVKEHMSYLKEALSDASVSRLACRLSPLSIRLWEVLVEAGASGVGSTIASRPALPWLMLATKLGVQKQKAVAIVTGLLLQKWGVEPSFRMGRLLASAYEAQLDGLFFDEASAYVWFNNNGVATAD